MTTVVSGPRQSGKTSKLIRMADKQKAYIVTSNTTNAELIAKQATEMGCDILHPITFRELFKGADRLRGSYIKKLLIDDFDFFVQAMFADSEIDIDAISILSSNNISLEG